MKPHELAPGPGSRRPRKRVGRGTGSGTGKTSGRGHKGQKARSGSSTAGFEGGQMPLYRRLPKRGFRPPNARRYAEVGTGRVAAAVAAGRLDPGAPVTAEALRKAGILRRTWDGVRLLASGELGQALRFEVAGASRAAVALVEKAGGSVQASPPKAAGPQGGADRAKGGAKDGAKNAAKDGEKDGAKSAPEQEGAAPADGAAGAEEGA